MADVFPLSGLSSSLAKTAISDAELARAKAVLGAKKLDEIDQTAKDFEGMFLSEMMTHMFETTPVDSTFGGGQAEETWRGMMIEQYSKQMVSAGGVGLADSVKAQMIAMQEAAQK